MLGRGPAGRPGLGRLRETPGERPREVCPSEFPVSPLEPSKGRVAGALIGVLLGVLFLSVAAFCLIRFQKERRKKPKETYGGSDIR